MLPGLISVWFGNSQTPLIPSRIPYCRPGSLSIMASMALQPRHYSSLKIYIKTQIQTRCIPPHETTSFAGHTAIITGSNTGIGLEASRQMLSRGLSHLIMGVRSEPKGEAAARHLSASHPSAKIEVWSLDMTSYKSIQAFSMRCAALERLNMVILNASVFSAEFRVCRTGHEEAFQVNYLSTALLAILLLPTLRDRSPLGSPGRLTIVSSNMGLTNKFSTRGAVPLLPSFSDKGLCGDGPERYATTKMLQLILTDRLSSCVSPEDVIINAVDPGLTAGSNLHRDFSGLTSAFFGVAKALTARSPEEAAWTYLDAAAVKGAESHGGFIVNWEVYP